MTLSKLLKAGFRYLTDADYRFIIDAGPRQKYNQMPDEAYLKRKFKATMGKELDLTSPKTFNEKLQWIKLYDRDPAYTVMVDKVAAKEYVAGLIGEKYIVPNLGVWEDPDDIDFDALPDRFALKCNHNSGLGMYICHDKTKMDVAAVKAELKKGLAQDYYLTGREWPYKDVPRRILCEKYMESGPNGLTDYKIHCFNGVPKFVLVCQDRFTETGLTEDFYTTAWERMDVKRPKISRASAVLERPRELSEMLELAKVLAKDIPFVRVDFYVIDGQVYFSELTFFPASGFEGYDPPEWDKTFGDWLELPQTS